MTWGEKGGLERLSNPRSTVGGSASQASAHFMLFRSLILQLAQNKTFLNWVRRLAIRSGLAQRFVAGENVSEVLDVVRDLHGIGIAATLNLLGEEVKDEKEAEAAANASMELLRAIDRSSVKSQISLKLSQLGSARYLAFFRSFFLLSFRRAIWYAMKSSRWSSCRGIAPVATA